MGKAGQPVRPVGRDELLEITRETIRNASGLSASEFKRKLPKPFQPHVEAVLALARELASAGDVHARKVGKTERFFSDDPIQALERIAREKLALAPLTQAALKRAVQESAPSLAPLFANWWKQAVTEKRVFEQYSASSKTKLFGTKPDRRVELKKPLTALRKALAALEARGLSKQEVVATTLEMLGLSEAEQGAARTTNGSAGGVSSAAPERASEGSAGTSEAATDRATFLEALKDLSRTNPDGALLPVRELRATTRLPKPRFDATALLLAREGAVTLHYHDHAASLPASERAELVQDDRGTHYMGIAFRRRT